MRSHYKTTTLERVSTLRSSLEASATRVLNKAWSSKIPMYVTWGSRSIEEQDLLYRFGRTLPGDIMTTKRGGYSPHNYGLALDFCLIFGDKFLSWYDIENNEYWRTKWVKSIKMFEAEGWSSGWRWPAFSPGHVENLMGFDIGELYRSYEEENQDGYNRL